MADQNILVSVGANISNLSQGLQQASNQVARFSADTQKTFEELGKIGAGMTAIGIGIAAGLGLSVSKAAEFDTAIRKAGAIAGASAGQLDAMKTAALDLGATTSQSASSVAVAMTEMAAKGFDANQVIAAMPGIISAAEASGEDLALTADTIASALNIFGLEAAESSRVADVLAKTANMSAAGIGDLGYVLKYAGAPAAALGISLEEVAAAAGIMTSAGLDGSSAGTALRASLLALNNPAKAQQKIMDSLGFSMTDNQGKTKSLSQLVGDLTKSMDGMTEAEKVATLAKLVGTEAVSGFLSLTKAGPAEIDKMSDALRNSGGASAEAAAKMKAGIGGALENLSGAFESLVITIGDKLVPYVQAAAKWLSGLTEKFTNISDGAMKFIVVGAALTAAFLLIAGPMLMLIGFIPSIVAGFAALATAGGWITTAFTAITGPIGLVVLAIAGLVAGIVWAYNQFDWFRAGVLSIWDQVKTYFNQALTFIIGIAKSVMGEVTTFFGAKLAEILAFWNKYGADIMTYVKLAFTYIVETIKMYMGIIKGVFQVIWPIIAGVVKIAWEGIKTIINNAIDLIKGIIKVGLSILSGDWKAAWTAIKQIAKDIMNNMIGFFKGINLWQIGKNIIQGLINGISSMGSAIGNAVKKIANAIPAKMKDMLGIHSPSRVLMEVGEFTGEGFVKGIQGVLASVKGASADMAMAAVPSLGYQTPGVAGHSYGRPLASATTSQGATVNLTLNYSGSGSEDDARGMLDMIERGLSDRLNLKARFSGLRA